MPQLGEANAFHARKWLKCEPARRPIRMNAPATVERLIALASHVARIRTQTVTTLGKDARRGWVLWGPC
jgi:hypothetical protein